MPPNSCSVPGRKPGTSSKVRIGMLKASQKRTKRAPFTEELISSTPARKAGWLPTMPTERPSMRPNPTTIFLAQCSWTSKNSPSSTTRWITSLMSDRKGRLVAHDAHGAAVHASESHHDIPGPMLVDLEEFAFVHHAMDHVLDVVRQVGLRRDDAVERGVHAVDRVVIGPARRVFAVVLRQVGHQFADH